MSIFFDVFISMYVLVITIHPYSKVFLGIQGYRCQGNIQIAKLFLIMNLYFDVSLVTLSEDGVKKMYESDSFRGCGCHLYPCSHVDQNGLLVKGEDPTIGTNSVGRDQWQNYVRPGGMIPIVFHMVKIHKYLHLK